MHVYSLVSKTSCPSAGSGREAFDTRHKACNVGDPMDTLVDQLKRFRDHPDGTVSGKSAGGEEDDLGMAVMLCMYWSLCVRASESRQCI